MKKILLVAALIAAFATGVSAQKETGFGSQFELGYGFKLKENKYSLFQVAYLPGYHFNPYFFAGIGIGISGYSNNDGAVITVPVFAHGTINFTADSKWTPFIAAKVGYGLGSTDILLAQVDPGFFITPAFGVKCKVSEKGAMSFALFGDYTSIKTTVLKNSTTENNGAIGLRLGYEF